MTVPEILALWDGYLWRKDTELAALAVGVTWLRALLDSKADVEQIGRTMGVDFERLKGA